MQNYDFIVIGAGSAGCVVARRLLDAGKKVAVLEAGGPDTNEAIADVRRLGELWHGPEDWDYFTTPQEHCHGRRLHLPRGKVLGGSHALNATIWVRGSRHDYDSWAYQGNPGWSWEDVLPVFRAIENFDGGESDIHGGRGLQDVVGNLELNPIQDSILAAAQEQGIPLNDDYNSGEIEGVSRMQLTVRDGKRFNTWNAYLQPMIDHENLTLVTSSHARKLIIEDNAVVGVIYEKDGARKSIFATETILTAGALNSPELLLRSGIGPAEELREAGVEVVSDLPGVGKNLHDHLLAPAIFTTMAKPVPAPEVSPVETHLFWKSEPHMMVPDTQPANFSVPMYDPTWMSGPENGFSLMAGLVRPLSRGSLRLSGPDFSDPILIDINALAEEQDVRALSASLRLCRAIGRSDALSEWGVVELYPGPDVDDDELEDYVRRSVITYHHQVGTCRMGTGSDAVVDPRNLRVHGVAGLRVADASVMPSVTTGNTNAPTIMIAERAAGFITGQSSF